MTSDPRYLFLCGCPRSGTSALWKLFSAHNKIALGLERYILKSIPSFELSKQDFSFKNFFKFKPGETHFSMLTPPEYYEQLKQSYNSCTVFGDKTPQLYIRYKELWQAFDKPVIVFIVRNILDVAQSYQNRYNDPKDNWSKDYRVAIKEWNVSLSRTFNAIHQENLPIHILEYEKVYNNDEIFKSIFNALQIEPDVSFENRYLQLVNQNKALESKRVIYLNSSQKKHILLTAKLNLYKQLVSVTN